jgi:hypothetical protein
VVRLAGQVEGDHVIFSIERIEPGPSSASARRTTQESGLDPERGLALWQRIGALFGAHVMVPQGASKRPGYRIAIGRASQ